MPKILVIDDSRFMRRLIADLLTKQNYEVDEAENGEIALEKLESGSYDLLTLDVEMPVLNGFETCKHIRQKDWTLKDIPIVFVTDNDNMEGREKGFLAGATDFVSKKTIPQELPNVISDILNPGKLDLSGTTCLVVDDSDAERKISSTLIVRTGAKVIEAASAEEALVKIKKDPCAFDLIMTDQIMPGMLGTEFSQILRKEIGLKEIPIVFLTARTDGESIVKIFASGATDYLAKPYLSEELMSRVSSHLKIAKLIKSLKESLDLSQQSVAEKDQVMSICAHDLKTPLNGIRGFSDLLIESNSIGDTFDKEAIE